MVGFALAALAGWQTGRAGFLAGGLVRVANWPYTLLAIMWGRLHAGRGALGAVATPILLGTLAAG